MTGVFRLDLSKKNDFWFNWEQPACPFFLGPCFLSTGKMFREHFKIPFFTSVAYFRNKVDGGSDIRGSWLLRKNEGKIIGLYLIDLFTNASYGEKYLLEYDNICQKIESFSRLQRGVDIVSHNLSIEYSDFVKLFQEFYMLGSITEPIQWACEDIIESFLKDAKFPKESKISNWSKERIKNAVYSTSCNQFFHEIEYHLSQCIEKYLELCFPDKIANGRKLSIKSIYSDNKEFKSIVDHHVDSFFWKKNNYYEAQEITKDHVLEEIENNIDSQGNNLLPDQKNKVDSFLEEVSIDRAHVIKSVDPYMSRILFVLDQYGTGLADKRKKYMSLAESVLEKYAQKISLITSIPLIDIKMAMPEEVNDIIDNPSLYSERLKSRRNGFAILESPFPINLNEFIAFSEIDKNLATSVPSRFQPTFAEGEYLSFFFSEIQQRFNLIDETNSRKEIDGVVVCKGDGADLIKGRAKVIFDPNMQNLNEGDILVASTTTPDFMGQIRKCKAIVTDQEGATTHAALISRELGIPCIIGTGNASSMIKNGDVVIMDMVTGKIRI